jgi:hypothetical protein
MLVDQRDAQTALGALDRRRSPGHASADDDQLVSVHAVTSTLGRESVG